MCRSCRSVHRPQASQEGSSERLVVGVHMETTAFNEVSETLDSLENGEKFAAVNSVLPFGVVKFLGKEGSRFPSVVDELLEDSTSPTVRGVCRYGDLRVTGREGQRD